ncbi:hypothetical protein U9M48_024238 [Paspalum notatum var. saurae]|uniref:Retrotransposon gag domain-containing protein n=1 Tax=Paspalum notatum var. saurae TaxID=547442 RepID=A0AAQ3TQX6_PASNO
MAEEPQGGDQWREHHPRGITYQDFEGLRPPVFTTCPEPLTADDWLCTIESKLTLLPGLTEQEKARASWSMQQGHVITWGELCTAFQAHYIPASLMEQKQHEFRELKQGNKTVMQYVQTFIHLSQYAPGDVADEPSREARLLQGSNPTLQTHLGRRYGSFTDLVDTTLDMENRLRVANEDQRRKRQANSALASPLQKQRATYKQPPRFFPQPRFVVRPTQPSWIHRVPQ